MKESFSEDISETSFPSLASEPKRKSKLLKRSHLKYNKFWRKIRLKLRSKYILSQPITNSITKTINGTLLEADTETFIPSYIVGPNSPYKIYWNLLISFTLLYIAFITSFTIAFLDSESFDFLEIIEIVLNFIYFIDFLINLNSAYLDLDGTLVTNRVKIMKNYLKTWMIIDIFSFIPFSAINYFASADTHNTNKYSKFIKLPRLYRLFKITRLLKLLNKNHMNDLFIKIQDFFMFRHSSIRFLSSLTSIVISVHIVSCMWYYTAKLDDFAPDTWVARYGYQDSDTGSIYIACLYWSITTLTTVGYGDMSGFTITEKALSIVWMLACLYFLGFTISSISSFLLNSKTREKKLNEKISLIEEFVQEAKLNKNMARRLKNVLKNSCQFSGFSWIDKQNIFNELPKDLKYEVSLAMHRGAAKRLIFFRDKDSTIISFIIPFLIPLCLKTGEVVYSEGDFADEVYFIVKGWVDYIYIEGCVISSIYRNDYFGDIEVVFHIHRKYSALARRNLELLVMNKNLLSRVKNDYRNLWEEISEAARNRNEKNKIQRDKIVRRTSVLRGSVVLQNKKIEMEDVDEKLQYLYQFAQEIGNKFEKTKRLIEELEAKGGD